MFLLLRFGFVFAKTHLPPSHGGRRVQMGQKTQAAAVPGLAIIKRFARGARCRRGGALAGGRASGEPLLSSF